MNSATIFAELLDSGCPLVETEAAVDVRRALCDLVVYANRKGELPTEGAWRLLGYESRRLEEAIGYRPPGGWDSLVGLAAGCRYFRASKTAFVPLVAKAGVGTSDDVSRELVEAMTCRLVPPAVAAGVFIALGIHPAWGLCLAKRVQDQHRGITGEESAVVGGESLFPKESMTSVRRGVFGTLAIVTAFLRTLDQDKKYPIDAFAEVIGAIVQYERRLAEADGVCTPATGLPPFLADGEGNRRVAAALARDVLQNVFVPAGVARLLTDTYVSVNPRLLEAVRVDELWREDQDRMLADFLSDGTGGAHPHLSFA